MVSPYRRSGTMGAVTLSWTEVSSVWSHRIHFLYHLQKIFALCPGFPVKICRGMRHCIPTQSSCTSKWHHQFLKDKVCLTTLSWLLLVSSSNTCLDFLSTIILVISRDQFIAREWKGTTSSLPGGPPQFPQEDERLTILGAQGYCCSGCSPFSDCSVGIHI